MRTDLLVAAGGGLLAAGYLAATYSIRHASIGDPLGPRAFPLLIGICMLLASALLVLETRRRKVSVGPADEQKPAEDMSHGLLLATIASYVVFILAFDRLGYLLSVTALLLVLTNLLHRGHLLTNAIVSVAFSLLSYLFFAKLLEVVLPYGILGF